MRLIDADKLPVKHGVDLGANYGGLRAIVLKSDIDNAPTVEAIPIEWLKKEAEDWEYHNELVALVLKSIIRGRYWEKENERV